jgi:hypothetical protein
MLQAVFATAVYLKPTRASHCSVALSGDPSSGSMPLHARETPSAFAGTRDFMLGMSNRMKYKKNPVAAQCHSSSFLFAVSRARCFLIFSTLCAKSK